MAEHLETFGSWTVDKVCLEGAAGQGEWTGIKGGVGEKIDITKVTCCDEKSIRSLAALLETADSWIVGRLELLVPGGASAQ